MTHTGKYSVPVLWDTQERCIVNNESAEIVRMFNSAFDEWATHPGLDLYPQHLRSTIDEVRQRGACGQRCCGSGGGSVGKGGAGK